MVKLLEKNYNLLYINGTFLCKDPPIQDLLKKGYVVISDNQSTQVHVFWCGSSKDVYGRKYKNVQVTSWFTNDKVETSIEEMKEEVKKMLKKKKKGAAKTHTVSLDLESMTLDELKELQAEVEAMISRKGKGKGKSKGKRAKSMEDSLENMDVAALKRLAAEYEISGRSKMNKQDLMTAIRKAISSLRSPPSL